MVFKKCLKKSELVGNNLKKKKLTGKKKITTHISIPTSIYTDARTVTNRAGPSTIN